MKDVLGFLKLIVILAIALALLFFGYTFFRAYEDGRIFAPEPPKTQAELRIEHEIALQKLEAERRSVVVWALIRWALWWLFVASASAVIYRYFIVPGRNAQRDFAIGENGVAKARVFDVRSPAEKLNPFSRPMFAVIDPSEQHVPAMRFYENGHFNVDGGSGGVDTRDQVELGRNVIQASALGFTAHSQAKAGRGRGMNKAEMMLTSGEAGARTEDAKAKAELSKMKLLAYQERAIEQIEETPVIDWTPIQFSEAIRETSKTKLLLGQSQESGRLAFWDLKGGNAHLRIHGETQSGKTTMQMLIVSQMVAMGWFVIICDRRKFKDWGALRGYAQLVDTTDPRALIHVLDSVLVQHEKRDHMVAKYGSGNIDNLPKPPRRIGLVIDEYGSQATYANEAKILDRLWERLRIITGEGASNGIHTMIGDQKPVADTWDSITRGNIGGVMVGFIAKGGGISAMGTDQAYLLNKHEFYYNKIDEPVKGWGGETYLPALLSNVPRTERNYIDLEPHAKIVERRESAMQKHGNSTKDSPKWLLCMKWLEENADKSQGDMIAALKGKVSQGYCNKAYREFHKVQSQ